MYNKINKFQSIYGIKTVYLVLILTWLWDHKQCVCRALRRKVAKETKLKCYKVTAISDYNNEPGFLQEGTEVESNHHKCCKQWKVAHVCIYVGMQI